MATLLNDVSMPVGYHQVVNGHPFRLPRPRQDLVFAAIDICDQAPGLQLRRTHPAPSAEKCLVGRTAKLSSPETQVHHVAPETTDDRLNASHRLTSRIVEGTPENTPPGPYFLDRDKPGFRRHQRTRDKAPAAGGLISSARVTGITGIRITGIRVTRVRAAGAGTTLLPLVAVVG